MLLFKHRYTIECWQQHVRYPYWVHLAFLSTLYGALAFGFGIFSKFTYRVSSVTREVIEEAQEHWSCGDSDLTDEACDEQVAETRFVRNRGRLGCWIGRCAQAKFGLQVRTLAQDAVVRKFSEDKCIEVGVREAHRAGVIAYALLAYYTPTDDMINARQATTNRIYIQRTTEYERKWYWSLEWWAGIVPLLKRLRVQTSENA